VFTSSERRTKVNELTLVANDAIVTLIMRPIATPWQSVPRRLNHFIADKLKGYVEPTKKGTPKGDPIGFSLVKYTATLYALRERVLPGMRDLASQAKELGVSYGVLRKWRSEPRFRDMLSQHEKEFMRYVVGPRGVVKPGLSSLGARLSLLRGASIAEAGAKKTEEAITKLIVLIHGNVQNDLLKSKPNPKTLREYQLLALNHAIETLKDRRATPKHRKAIINLLSGVRESLE
jgi:hypothetical protein